ncbi:MAG TPA: hypothetical protein VGO98_02005 [Candidatus Saccharimonadales bacterium]|jgi:hypothetical protein|nr:hypothetical protein [Candidatus Saccharimonadales bacterium]
MELVPPIPENSEHKSRSVREHERRKWAGRIAIHPPYEAGTTAYSDLGGGLPSHRPDQDPSNYPTGIDETILFAGKHQRESVDPRHFEIIRAYELSLDVLTPAQFHNDISLKDQMHVAVAGHDVIKLTERRANLLKIDGNFEHPAFLHYEFASQHEADEYAGELKLLQHELMTRDVVADIERAYEVLKAKSLPSTMAKLKKQTRNLTVSIERDGKVIVSSKPPTK